MNNTLESPTTPQSPTVKTAYVLALRFIRDNPTWSIDSAITYCLREYKHHGLTRRIFADALHKYIVG